jgi:hypothetical protein
MDARELIAEFEAGTLPKSRWTHQAHLTMALWHVTQSADVWSAICVIKDRIIGYNRIVGTCNTGSSGYHETITIFWATQLFDFWKENPDLPFETLADKLVHDPRFKDTGYIKQFYDGETLKSARARATYVPPAAAVDNARPAHG